MNVSDWSNTLLVHLPLDGRESYVVPLGLCAVAGELRAANCHVSLLDIPLYTLTAKSVRQIIRDSGASVIGISAMTSQYRYYLWLASVIKQEAPNAYVVCGGPLATHQYDLVLRTTETAACIVGEAEGTLRDLLSGNDWRQIPGVATIVENRVSYTPRRRQLSLDALHPVNLDIVDVDGYVESIRGFHISPRRALNYSVSRGCPYSCAFCSRTFTSYRYKSYPRIVEELAQYKELHGVEVILLSDELAIPSPAKAIELSQLMGSLGLGWCAEARVDSVNYSSLLQMRQGGCLSVAFGIESGSPQILARMQKRFTLQESEESCSAARRADLDVFVHMMFGFPGEDDSTLRESLEFCIRTGCFPPRDDKARRCVTSLAVPYPGSHLYAQCRRSGLIHDEGRYTKKLSFSYTKTVEARQVPLNLTHWPTPKLVSKKLAFERELYRAWAFSSATPRI